MNKKTDTTKNMQTKEWETKTMRLHKSVAEALSEDAKMNMRPVGMHIAWIINYYLQKIRENRRREYDSKTPKGTKPTMYA